MVGVGRWGATCPLQPSRTVSSSFSATHVEPLAVLAPALSLAARIAASRSFIARRNHVRQRVRRAIHLSVYKDVGDDKWNAP